MCFWWGKNVVVSPNRGHLACLRTCSCSFGKSLRGRHPIRGKKDPPTTLLNVPPQAGSRIHLAGEGGEFTTTDVRLKPGVSEVASDNVVDTTGAGDSYLGGFLAAHLGAGPSDSEELARFQASAEHAHTVAALCVQRYGACKRPVTRGEARAAGAGTS